MPDGVVIETVKSAIAKPFVITRNCCKLLIGAAFRKIKMTFNECLTILIGVNKLVPKSYILIQFEL